MRPTSIRVIALGLCFDRRGRLLVERGFDGVRGEAFLRGIGGGVEPGERAADALRREWREEFALTLAQPSLLGVLENFFTHEGRAGHEIVFVFRAEVVERWVYERDAFSATESSSGGEPGAVHEALWVELDAVRRGGARLLPAGLLEMAAAV